MLKKKYTLSEVIDLIGADNRPAFVNVDLAGFQSAEERRRDNSPIHKAIIIFGQMKRAFDTRPSKPVSPMDQATLIAYGLNSNEGQAKLQSLDWKPGTGTHGTAILTEMPGLYDRVPGLRMNGSIRSAGKTPRIKIEILKVQGSLRIHAAFVLE